MRVGRIAIDDVGLGIALRKGSTYRVTNVAGVDDALLGNAFMSRFRVRFDYPNEKLALLPRSDDRFKSGRAARQGDAGSPGRDP